MGAAGVLERVGERLLHDAVRGQVDTGTEVARLTVDGQLDGKAGRSRLRDELLELRHPGLRGESELLAALAQQADQSPHLLQRLAARALGGEQRLLGIRGIGPDELARATGLDDHRC